MSALPQLGLGQLGLGHTLPPGGWALPGASLHADFANSRLFGASDFASAFAITRASAGYAEDIDGNWLAFSSGQMRRTGKGVLIEEARTNSIRNNSMQGAVVGTPGTLPTHWSVFSSSGLTTNVVGIGTQNGLDYVDLRIAGTTTNTFYVLSFEAAGNVPASTGQVWIQSLFAALVGGSMSNISSIKTNLRPSTGGTTDTAFNALTSTLARQPPATATMGASVTGVGAALLITFSTGVVIDITLRIGWPQLELGAFATSPIRTTNAAATRAADVITLNNPTNYVSLAQGSAFVEWGELVGSAALTDRRIFSMRVDSFNTISINVTSGNAGMSVANAGVSMASLYSTVSVAAGNNYKMSGRWGTNDFAMRKSASLGSDPANDNSGAPPTGVFVAGIGNGNGSVFLNGYLRQLALFLTPQNDNQLAAMVA